MTRNPCRTVPASRAQRETGSFWQAALLVSRRSNHAPPQQPLGPGGVTRSGFHALQPGFPMNFRLMGARDAGQCFSDVNGGYQIFWEKHPNVQRWSCPRLSSLQDSAVQRLLDSPKSNGQTDSESDVQIFPAYLLAQCQVPRYAQHMQLFCRMIVSLHENWVSISKPNTSKTAKATLQKQTTHIWQLPSGCYLKKCHSICSTIAITQGWVFTTWLSQAHSSVLPKGAALPHPLVPLMPRCSCSCLCGDSHWGLVSHLSPLNQNRKKWTNYYIRNFCLFVCFFFRTDYRYQWVVRNERNKYF